MARLRRGGARQQAYVYPAGRRATRDLWRRRPYLVPKRAETSAHLQNTNSPSNPPPFGNKLGYAAHRAALDLADRFTDPRVQKPIALDLSWIDHTDALLGDVEPYRTRTAQVDDPQA
jgi:hypothetical protein